MLAVFNKRIEMIRFVLFLLCVSTCLNQNAGSENSGFHGNLCKPKYWTNTNCVTDEDCGQTNTLCYMDKCLCQPGFFFSPTYYMCSDTCSTSDLDNTFMEYPDSGIKGHNLEVREGLCLDACKNLCLSTNHCITFDFRAAGGLCQLHDVTSRQSSSGWYPKTSKGWTHYQRSCLTKLASYREWYNLLCNNNVDCPDTHSQCLSGRCLCPSGTLFNETQNACRVSGFNEDKESCGGWKTTGGKSGVYSIQPAEIREELRVWCDMDSGDGGWLVFQRRRDGSVDFYRNWTQYENGFGDVTGEFWLGLSKLYTLTSGRQHRLRVDLSEVNGEQHYAEYSSFTVGGPETNYRLTLSGYSGTAGDSMADHNNQSFSTYDRDNDKDSGGSCAADRHGAWWYIGCANSNLNGRYKVDGAVGHDGINWYTAHGDTRSFTFTEMKVKPV